MSLVCDIHRWPLLGLQVGHCGTPAHSHARARTLAGRLGSCPRASPRHPLPPPHFPIAWRRTLLSAWFDSSGSFSRLGCQCPAQTEIWQVWRGRASNLTVVITHQGPCLGRLSWIIQEEVGALTLTDQSKVGSLEVLFHFLVLGVLTSESAAGGSHSSWCSWEMPSFQLHGVQFGQAHQSGQRHLAWDGQPSGTGVSPAAGR